MGCFERVLAGNPAGDSHLADGAFTHADLSLFQVVAGLRYAFPAAMAGIESNHPRVIALHDAVVAQPRIAAGLDSERRIPFNEDGIFRCYPELDE